VPNQHLIDELAPEPQTNAILKAGYALQSWLFAQLIQVFQFTGQKLVDQANFWALMFFALAIAMSTFYFLLGTSANTMSMVCRHIPVSPYLF
jgi:ATP-binding cassette subfamily B (MDR/TAP) protein 1